MKKLFFLSVLIVLVMSSFSVADANNRSRVRVKYHLSSSELYRQMGLVNFDLAKEALDYAVKGYEKLLDQGKVDNQQYLSIVDFTKPSDEKRFYLLDLLNRKVVMNTYVMHGRNSGKLFAERFSNRINSNESSLGFYKTSYTYNGSRGYSLRLNGLEKGFNSNAAKRGVVVHGSNYINEERAKEGKIARSEGCPAIPRTDTKEVIRRIKDGSILFIYHPTEKYLEGSSILNDNPVVQPTDDNDNEPVVAPTRKHSKHAKASKNHRSSRSKSHAHASSRKKSSSHSHTAKKSSSKSRSHTTKRRHR
ncbi:MAG: murein L,D-transpeptidase catalytic domain family protein [Candidatus Dadabacteria bacterium]